MDANKKGKEVEVIKKNNSVVMVRVIFEDKILNIISAYAPQVECKESQKEEFWKEMDEVMQ